MARALTGNPVGLAFAAVWRTSANGEMYGTKDPDTVVNGDEFFPYLLRYPTTANIPTPERVIAQLRGGDRWLGSVSFGISEMPSFTFGLSNEDLTLKALASNSAVDSTTNSRWHRSSDNINLGFLPQMGLMLMAQFQSRDAGSDGAPLWVTYIVPRCTIQPGNPSLAYQTGNDISHQVVMTNTDREPHGLLFSSGNMALSNNQAAMYAIVAEKPLMFAGFLGDDAQDTITLPYVPASTVVTLNAAANELVNDGDLEALSSVNTGTSLATLAGAVTAGDYAGILYEADERFIASS
jgi:hypothetical protein